MYRIGKAASGRKGVLSKVGKRTFSAWSFSAAFQLGLTQHFSRGRCQPLTARNLEVVQLGMSDSCGKLFAYRPESSSKVSALQP